MASPVKPGDVLAGKYRVDRVLGVGGMGVVVAAEHIELHQKVALKFMLPEALEDEAGVDRFMREARAAVRLKGEHVARVMDVGRLENGAPYIVMEYLQGGDLGDTIRARGALPIEEAITYVMQACMAMAEAHSQGIVHRDLKPENLFLAQRPDGRPLIKVLDFGISKILSAPGEMDVSTTKTSTMMGSPAYMAPEQMRSAKHVDARADVWSLGAILYQLLTGVLPFQADTAPEMFAKVLYEAPEPMGAFAPHVPAELEAVIGRCLQKDIEQRYASVPEFATALARFGDDGTKSLARFIHKTFFGNKHTAPPIAPMDLPPTALPLKTTNRGADATPLPVATVPGHQGKAVNVTTHGAATGEMSASDPIAGYVPPTAGRGKWYALGGIAVAGVIGIVVATSGGGGGAVMPGAAQPEPVAIDAGVEVAVEEVAPPDAGVVQAAVSIDAAIEQATAKVEPEPKRTRRPRRRTVPVAKTPEPKKSEPVKTKTKKPVEDDPFGTIQ